MSEVTEQVELYCADVLATLKAAKVDPNVIKGYPIFEREALGALMMELNPKYPRDSLQVIEAAWLVAKRKLVLLSFDEVALVKQAWRDGCDWSGDLHLKLKWPELVLSFSSKHSGRYFELSLKGAEGRALTLPVQAKLTVWGDMDQRENHADHCPVFNPEHKNGCPCLRLLSSDDDFTDEDWDAAEAECYCAADDCNCEAQVDRVASLELKSGSGAVFVKELADWISWTVNDA